MFGIHALLNVERCLNRRTIQQDLGFRMQRSTLIRLIIPAFI